MADPIGIVVRHMLSVGTLKALVSDRIYPGFIATVAAPVYPCYNVTAQGGGNMELNVTTWGGRSFRLYAISDVSPEDAHSVYKAAYDNMQKWTLKDGAQAFEIREVSPPAEALMSGDPAVYQAMGIWEMYGNLLST